MTQPRKPFPGTTFLAAHLSLNLRDRARLLFVARAARRTPSVDGSARLYRGTGPSLSRTRLTTLPFFCLSVSGRKLAPSALSLKRVSRTESGQLASGWHHSSPFRHGRARLSCRPDGFRATSHFRLPGFS